MQTLTDKFIRIKTSVGGNREKQRYEETFGMPHEEQAHVTMPNKWQRRIIGELDFAIRLSSEHQGSWDELLHKICDDLINYIDMEGSLTRSVITAAETKMLPLQQSAKEYKLILAAHAHIDMNWMWSWQETVTATLETFRTMLNIMDEYPDFCFSQSQASCYKIVEDYDPELMDAIKKRIQEGRWEVTASAWVETDKNMPCTESLMRHILYTKKYMSEKWGVSADALSLDFSPDTFGHSSHLPTLIKHGNVKYYYHCRGLDGDDVLFRWKAPSGDDVLVYREPYWYNSGITPHIGSGLIDISNRCAKLKTGLIVYGVGDHGGGPTRRDVETAMEMMNWPVYPRIVFGTFSEYFAAAESVKSKLKVVDHEFNFIFPGCYTTQSRIKLGNRKAEAALTDAETASVLANLVSQTPYSYQQFEDAWQKVLFTHFHDILTGSCVQETREHAMTLYGDALAAANTQRIRGLRAIAGKIDTSSLFNDDSEVYAQSLSEGAGAGYGIDDHFAPPVTERGSGIKRVWHVFNPSFHDRSSAVQITVWDWPGDLRLLSLTDANGMELPFQLLDNEIQNYWDHKYVRLLVDMNLPAAGYATCIMNQKTHQTYPFYYQPEKRTHKPYENIILENKYLRAVFDHQSGSILSLVDKDGGHELIKQGDSAGLRLVHTDGNTDNAWLIGRYMSVEKLEKNVQIKPIGSSSSIRQGLKLEVPCLDSTAAAEIWLDQNSRALQFDYKVDWNESSKGNGPVPLLIYHLPLAESPEIYRYDVPGGYQDRNPMHLDVPGLQYAAAVYDKRALILSSDSKYGYRGTTEGLSVSLIHSSNKPDPYPERGIHHFSLAVGVSDSSARDLHEMAFDFWHKPAYVSATKNVGRLPLESSFASLDVDTSAVICSVKCCETDKNNTIIRLNNLDSQPTRFNLTIPFMIKDAVYTDLLENETENTCCSIHYDDNHISGTISANAIVSIKVTI